MRREGDKENRTGVQPGRRQVVTKGRQPVPTSEPLLPHERDETSDPHGLQTGSKDVIEQAGRDIKRGLRDTERRGTPSDVPGPGADPETTPGADVPHQDQDGEKAGGRARSGENSHKPRSPRSR